MWKFGEEKLNTPPKVESLRELNVDPSVSIDATARCAIDEQLCRKLPATEGRACTVSLLSVSPVAADHDELQQALHPGQWTIYKAQTLSAALAA